MLQLYNDVSFRISGVITRSYSTSFSIAVSFLKPELRNAIYSIYGFVRLADEIVDTFHSFDKKELLDEFESSYYKALNDGISLNPVLNAFQITVKKYKINDDLVKAFLRSMRHDLTKTGIYGRIEIDDYIYGSAEVVGLMCLNVFTGGDQDAYNELLIPARSLGAAFQKVNFLRDLGNDVNKLNRSYFPGIDASRLTENEKSELISDIEKDFSESFRGIRKLPREARLPVLIAFYYYRRLLRKIKRTPSSKLTGTRIRVGESMKMMLLARAYLEIKMGIV